MIQERRKQFPRAYSLDFMSPGSDFANMYTPTDDWWGTPSGEDNRPSFHDCEALASERVGFGWHLTKLAAGDVVRNGFDFIDYENRIIKKPHVFKWMIRSDFMNQLETLLRYERTYGVAFLVKYWGKNDKFETKPPKKPPLKFQAFPPTVLTPYNVTETGLLDYDEEVWEFVGGKYNTTFIHKDRIHVLITRKVPDDWRGLSVFEPIYFSSVAYVNLIINMSKGLAKFGNVIMQYMLPEEFPSIEMYREYAELVEDFKATYTFIVGKDQEVKFQDTKIATGVNEFGEFLKEDICSGTGFPLNELFGRAVSGGIGGQGALTSERGKIQTISNIQHNISDDVWKIIRDCGWRLDDLMVKFRLDLQKTERARLEEESIQWDNKIKEKQWEALALQNVMQAMQFQEQLRTGTMLPFQENERMLENQAGQEGEMSVKKPGSELGSIQERTSDFLRKNAKLYRAVLAKYGNGRVQKND